MLTCSRKIHFCYGHRLMGHENKCATLHGHNATVWIEATSLNGQTDSVGRIIDFALLKEKVGKWIDQNWDHTMIICKEDKETIKLLKQVPGKKEIFILPNNPTAENLASYLLWEVCPKVLKGHGVIVTRIEFCETANCKATATADPHDPRFNNL